MDADSKCHGELKIFSVLMLSLLNNEPPNFLNKFSIKIFNWDK